MALNVAELEAGGAKADDSTVAEVARWAASQSHSAVRSLIAE